MWLFLKLELDSGCQRSFTGSILKLVQAPILRVHCQECIIERHAYGDKIFQLPLHGASHGNQNQFVPSRIDTAKHVHVF